MSESADPRERLFHEFFSQLDRMAPGSAASTRKALSLVDGLPAAPRIVEFGAGAGAATLVLAESTRGTVTAVDRSSGALERLTRRARNAGLGDRICPIRADMRAPLLPASAFDLVWAEGAAYVMGFARAIETWGSLLAPGGWVALTELTWLTDSPPSAARAFWRAAYPPMATVEDNLAAIRALGFDPVAHFPLPRADWWEGYYAPLEVRLRDFRAEYPNNPAALEVAAALQAELDLWKTEGASYGYVFYLLRRRRDK